MDKKKDKLLASAILAGTLSAIAAVTRYLAKKWAEVSLLANGIDPPPTEETLFLGRSACADDVISE